jgi:3-methyladenine DNA glycosylase AlkD
MKKKHPYIEILSKEYRLNAVSARSVPMKRYMRNQFEFYGISSPERKAISSEFIKNHPVKDVNELHEIVEALWKLPQREYQYFAIDLLSKNTKMLTENDAPFLEKLIVEKSWWDTVDSLAGHVTGPWFRIYPDQIKTITGRWNRSENIWLQRMSLLFQLKYKKETNTILLAKYIKHLSKSKEFFVQKAIGWILREYSKTNPEWVKVSVREYTLAPLSKREAIKRIAHL